MSYTYRIIKTTRTKSGPYQQIQEIDATGFFLTWSIGEIMIDDKSKTDVLYESFNRTKKWMEENHPELLNMNYQYKIEEDRLKRKCIVEILNEIVILDVRIDQILDFDKNYYFDIHLFKQNQANTTFYSLLASVVNNFLISFKEKLIFFRILNILIFFILLYFFYKTIKISLEEKSQILSLILFCPIITIYAFRIYPDFISICISWLSIIFLLNEKKKISILLFCLSFLLKPVAIVIFPFLIFVIFKKFKYKKKFENYLLIFYYIFFLLVTYTLYFFLFEQIIFNEYYKTTYYNFNFYNTFLNFFYYYNYSILLIFPFIIYLLIFFFIKNKISISEILYLTIIALLLSSFLKFHLFNNGEMNYGYINKLLINIYIVYFLIFTNTFLGIFLFYIFYKEKKIKIVFLVFFICLFFYLH